MKRRVALIVACAALLAAGFACKEKVLLFVTLDLGVDNRGSAGFGCTEDRSATCRSLLGCALRPSTKQATGSCMSEACADAGGADRDCARLALCIRLDGGSASECYSASCETQPLLADRASDGKGGSDVHLLVDYVGLGGTPGCRGSELRSWCTVHACRPVRRWCIPLHLPSGPDTSGAAIARSIASAFAAQRTLDDDAPDVPVVVRVVGVAKSGPCSAEEEALDATLAGPLVGCAYSCPTVLTSTQGPLTIDFDLLGSKCSEAEVLGCARLFDGDGGAPASR